MPVVKSYFLVEKVMVDSVPVVGFVVGLQRGPLQRINPVVPVVDPEVVLDDPVESLANVASVEGALVGAVVGGVEASVVVESNVDPVEPIVVGKVAVDGLVENWSVESSPLAVVLVGSEEMK